MTKLTKAQKQAFQEAIAALDFRDSRERNAVAQEIVRFVQEDVYGQDLVSLLAETENFGPGESVEFHTFRELKAYIVEPGSFAPRATLHKDKIVLPTHRVVLSTEIDLQQLRSGRYGGIEKYNTKAGEALLGMRNKLVWDTLRFAIPSTSTDGNYFTFASGATAATKKTALDSAINVIHDNYNAGPSWIVGRHSALDWLEDIGVSANISEMFPEETKEQIMRAGFLTTYRGLPVMRMRAYANQDGVAQMGADDIFIISPGTVKFGSVSPGLDVLDEINVDTYSWRINYWEEYGCAVVESGKNARIAIS